MIGASYSANLLSPKWGLGAAPESADDQVFSGANVQGIFGVFRLIVPIKRVDIGIEAAPGFAWQFFNANEGRLIRTLPGSTEAITVQRETTRGFSLKLAPMVNVFVSRRVYLGMRADVMLSFHGESCYQDAATLQNVCVSKSYVDPDRRAPIATLGIKGLVGFVF
jgi:hypothetical protein